MSVIPVGVDPTRPSPARLYDYYLGGTHNFEVDRQAAEQGIRQFLDIGPGLARQSNTHQAVHNALPGRPGGVRGRGPDRRRLRRRAAGR